MVSETRLLRFLKEQVENRPPLKRGRKRKKPQKDAEDDENAQEDGNTGLNLHENQDETHGSDKTQIFLHQMKQYVSAANHLWQWQKSHAGNLHPTPNGIQIKGYMTSMRKMKHQRKEARFEDRGKSKHI